ncbi:hypothetical protein JHK82_024331 [Glycine max]|nr:hypothetical protein JHK85_024914 [Glycine max]KAG5012162.1 hypothetical protein JHK86_024423 [Glycine max]KAG5133143.1 hypothetical protein JHK82_024331 [Glycine max]
MFGLLEENAKSIEPMVTLSHIGASSTMMGVLNANVDDPKMEDSLKIACDGSTGSTTLGNGSSCEWLDNRTKASYAFNAYYQLVTNQSINGCEFNGLASMTGKDPSPPKGTCKFDIGLEVVEQLATSPSPTSAPTTTEPGPDKPNLESRASDPRSKKSLAVETRQPNLIVIVAMVVFSLMLTIIL